MGRELPDGGPDQAWLGANSFRNQLRKAANIGFAVGMILVQLINWSGWSHEKPGGTASEAV